MKSVNQMSEWETEGRETCGAVEYLLDCVGCKWEEYPTEPQLKEMLKILNEEFDATDEDSLFWGQTGEAFKAENGKWVAVL